MVLSRMDKERRLNMLISSKNKNEKIVLGLLSYTYTEGNAAMTDMLSLIETYRNDPNLDILLYKDESNDNFIGLLCIEINTATAETEDSSPSTTIIINRISVVPSFRSEGIGYRMYEALRRKYPNASVIGAMNTVDLLLNWSKQYNENNPTNVPGE